MFELMVLGGLLWWIGKKGKEALEDVRVTDREFWLAQLAEKHRIPFETSDGTLLTWEQPSTEIDRAPEYARPEFRIELHDNRSINQHLHFHIEQSDED